jgi:ribosomal protein L7/L12
MTKVETLVDELVALSVVELLEFKKILKDKYNLEESIAVVAAPIIEPEKVEEKTSFDVILTKIGEGGDKLSAVKIINNATKIGLKPAMDLTKNLPATLLKGVSKIEAETIKNELSALNATIEIV